MTDGPTITYDSQNNNLGLFGYIHMQILLNSYAKLILDVPSGRNDHVHIVLSQFSVPTSSVF